MLATYPKSHWHEVGTCYANFVLERLDFLLNHPQSVRFVIRSWFGWVAVVRSFLVELVLHVVFNLTEDVQDLVSVMDDLFRNLFDLLTTDLPFLKNEWDVVVLV